MGSERERVGKAGEADETVVDDRSSTGVLAPRAAHYKMSVPDNPRRYGLIIFLVGSVVSLMALSFAIQYLANNSGQDDSGDGASSPLGAPGPSTGNESGASVGGAQSDSTDQQGAGKSKSGAGSSADGSANQSKTVVPAVLGLHVADAVEGLVAVNLNYSVIETSSDTVKPGFVASSNPQAGATVDGGAIVILQVSSGSSLSRPGRTVTPSTLSTRTTRSTTGSTTLSTARRPTAPSRQSTVMASTSGQTAETDRKESPPTTRRQVEQPATTAKQVVVLTTPSNRVVATSEPVTIATTQPASPSGCDILVPDVVGRQESDGVRALEEVGLNVLVTNRQLSEAPAGAIYKQDFLEPQSNRRSCSGDTILLGISTAQPECNILVPNVVGRQELDGVRALENLGLKISVTNRQLSTRPTGAIYNQGFLEPQSNQRSCAGDTVLLRISTGIQNG